MRSYTIGNELVFTTEITDPATGQPTTGSDVTLTLLQPDGVVVPVPCALADQTYTGAYTPTVPGVWWARWQSIGEVATAIEVQFEITPSAFN